MLLPLDDTEVTIFYADPTASYGTACCICSIVRTRSFHIFTSCNIGDGSNSSMIGFITRLIFPEMSSVSLEFSTERGFTSLYRLDNINSPYRKIVVWRIATPLCSIISRKDASNDIS